ncbi:MAG TPA: nuclear transport factor 2 family protein [Ktedonobacteraceae bacterium]
MKDKGTPVLEITESLHVVHRWIDAFNQHQVSDLVALYAQDAELFDAGMKRKRRGHKEIEGWFTSRFRMTPTITYTPHAQFTSDGQIAVQWTTRGRIERLLGQKWLARPFTVDGVSVFYIENGLIQKQRGYYDHLSALEQILPPIKWVLPLRL